MSIENVSVEKVSVENMSRYPLDGVTNPKYKLLYFLTTIFVWKWKKVPAFNWDRCCHLALCLWLTLFQICITQKKAQSKIWALKCKEMDTTKYLLSGTVRSASFWLQPIVGSNEKLNEMKFWSKIEGRNVV